MQNNNYNNSITKILDNKYTTAANTNTTTTTSSTIATTEIRNYRILQVEKTNFRRISFYHFQLLANFKK